MTYAISVLSLLMLPQIIYISHSEPLFGSENVHIKVHVPEEISHTFDEVAFFHEHKNKIKHKKHRAHAPNKHIRHNQHNSFLESVLFSGMESPFDSVNFKETKEHLLHHTAEGDNVYTKIASKRPAKYINTYKVVEYNEPDFGKSGYQNQPNHFYHLQKPATYTETFKIVELTNQQPNEDRHSLDETLVSIDYPGYQDDISAKPLKLPKNANEITYVATPDDYFGYKSAYTRENIPNYAETKPFRKLPNTNAYLPPYESPSPTIDIPNLTRNLLLPPIKGTEDFHVDLHSPASHNVDFIPFVGHMYLPVREAATETYTGFDSYSASHVQGIDDQNYTPHRRRGIII